MAKAHEKKSGPISRRHFLGAVGAAVVAANASSSLLAPVAQAQSDRFVRIREDRFGRMFPNLDPFFRENTPALQAALRDIGKPGGILDARDELGDGDEAAAIALIVDPALSANNPNNLAQTAGTTFIGQFIDHDLTFDQTSALGRETEPADSPNTRNPRFDLDSVYGDGPLANPELYEPVSRTSRERPTKLRIESGGLFEDVPRNQDGSAIIADPRNDENMMISGLQAAFLLFHNNAVDLVKHEDRGASSEEVYEKANQLTRWHYQWIVLYEILPLFIGQAAVDNILNNGRKFYRPEKPQIPVEFQGAAYRMGHTLVRPSYRANLAGDNDGTAFFGMVFDPSGELPRTKQTRRTCAVGPGRAGASSAGRRSSISAPPSRTPRAIPIRRSGRTSGSTRPSPRRCSICRSARSRGASPATSFPFPSATCSVASPGASRPGRASPGQSGRRCSTATMTPS